MKIQIVEVVPGRWSIRLVTDVGTTAGMTTYPTADAAERIARAQHPGKPIEVIR